MKNLFFFLFLLVSTTAVSQNSPAKPEFADLPVLFNKTTGTRINTIKENCIVKAGSKNWVYECKGITSSAAADSSANLSILIDFSSDMLIGSMKLINMQQVKGNRKAEVPLDRPGSKYSGLPLIEFNIRKIEGNFCEFIPVSSLGKGEYLLTNGLISFSFRIQ